MIQAQRPISIARRNEFIFCLDRRWYLVTVILLSFSISTHVDPNVPAIARTGAKTLRDGDRSTFRP